jgi:hypothetical protein
MPGQKASLRRGDRRWFGRGVRRAGGGDDRCQWPLPHKHTPHNNRRRSARWDSPPYQAEIRHGLLGGSPHQASPAKRPRRGTRPTTAQLSIDKRVLGEVGEGVEVEVDIEVWPVEVVAGGRAGSTTETPRRARGDIRGEGNSSDRAGRPTMRSRRYALGPVDRVGGWGYDGVSWRESYRRGLNSNARKESYHGA